MSKWKFVIQDRERERRSFRCKENSMTVWVDKNYRSLMLYAMAAKLLLLSILVVVEIVVAFRGH
jgi:hypothetical protein